MGMNRPQRRCERQASCRISRGGSGEPPERGGRLNPFARIASSLWYVLLCFIAVLRAFHRGAIAFAVDGVVGTTEEAAKHISREVIRQILRFSNSFSAFVVSIVDDSMSWRNMRRTFSQEAGTQGAWRQFWSTSQRTSSFNALFEPALQRGQADIAAESDGTGSGEATQAAASGGSHPGPRRRTTARGLGSSGDGHAHLQSSYQGHMNGSLLERFDFEATGVMEDLSVAIQVVITHLATWVKKVCTTREQHKLPEMQSALLLPLVDEPVLCVFASCVSPGAPLRPPGPFSLQGKQDASE